jgi:allophanate hydrolase
VARPGLLLTGDGPPGGVQVEVWQLGQQALGALAATIPAPLGLGTVLLDDGTPVTGFLAEPHGVRGATDITSAGGWRAHLRDTGEHPGH